MKSPPPYEKYTVNTDLYEINRLFHLFLMAKAETDDEIFQSSCYLVQWKHSWHLTEADEKLKWACYSILMKEIKL